jgi:post-segregation antitoxin (ccd killing protein)
MKSKINLTIDEELIPQSKDYAKKQGLSVSQLVEELLRRSVQNDKPSFSSHWRGKFKVADKDDGRFNKLQERYLS